MAGLGQLTTSLAFLAAAITALSGEPGPSVPLAADDECAEAAPGATGRECTVNALQFRAAKATMEWPIHATCAAKGCSRFVRGQSCQCNSKCRHYGNCCMDFYSTCSPEDKEPKPKKSKKMPAPVDEDTEGEGKPFQCTSTLKLGPVVKAPQKGMALDDTTFKECASSIPAFFPNTDAPVKSLRLFKAWDPEWPAEGRLPAWKNLASFVKANGVKVLMGTEVTCNETLDNESWVWAKGLLELLGPEHVMGLSIGNELELLYTVGNRRKVAPVTPECISKLWKGGRAWEHFQEVVEEFDAMGFGSVPVTSVLGGYALAGHPFVDTKDSQVNTFLTKATEAYGQRFVFTFNFYPYFDTNMHLDHHGGSTCSGALKAATRWGHSGFVPSILRAALERVAQLAPGSRVWLGETGWSSPYAPSLESEMRNCPDWSSESTLHKFYEGFLGWDMAGVDHVFYFTMRDSEVFGVAEYFGLVSSCSAKACKLQ